MRVICINNKPIAGRTNGRLEKIKEGDPYTVFNITPLGGYVLLGIDNTRNGYAPERFIPLSHIDETELVNQRELINS